MTATPEMISKIRKLLALATSSNEHEAANAANAARKLMLKHGLEMGDLEHKDEKFQIFHRFMGEIFRPMPWRVNLYNVVAEFYGCVHHRKPGGKVYISGPESAAEVAAEMVYYFEASLTRHFKAAHKENPNLDVYSYRFGWVNRLSERLEELKKSNDGLDESEMALVVVNDSHVRDWSNSNLTVIPGRTVSIIASHAAHGGRDANTVSLHAQIR